MVFILFLCLVESDMLIVVVVAIWVPNVRGITQLNTTFIGCIPAMYILTPNCGDQSIKVLRKLQLKHLRKTHSNDGGLVVEATSKNILWGLTRLATYLVLVWSNTCCRIPADTTTIRAHPSFSMGLLVSSVHQPGNVTKLPMLTVRIATDLDP